MRPSGTSHRCRGVSEQKIPLNRESALHNRQRVNLRVGFIWMVELVVPCGARLPLSAQRRHMLQILPALLCAPFVASLVLGGDQRVGTAAPFGREVKVARRASHALLDMSPPILDRLQAPLLLIRRNQERAQSMALATCAFEWVGPGPVPW